MARMVLQAARKPTNVPPASARIAQSEGEAAAQLMIANGFLAKRKSKENYEFACPFHEQPGPVERGKSANFYIHAESSIYQCFSALCGERGNLTTLERHFGVDVTETTFITRESRLQEYEANLPRGPLRKPFYEHGLSDVTIERFRLGFWPEHVEERDGKKVRVPDRYVIPYLEGRRPVLFRFYQPDSDPKYKYTWEEGTSARLFNPQDAIGDKDGRAFICEGEQKAMYLVQLGYAAVSVPGATMFKAEWHKHFAAAREVIVLFDNDNPTFHMRDECNLCGKENQCVGHNPGQTGAMKVMEQFGWRAKNIVLPLPNENTPKTDINEYFMRDGKTAQDFAEFALGVKVTPYIVQSLAQIIESPPEETQFLVEQGILPKQGRLLIAGKPKVGKSLFVNNLAMSLAAGIPFLGRFGVDHPTRVLLLDRELSKSALFSRLGALMDYRAGYKAAVENLLVDHDHLLKLDRDKEAESILMQLVEQNGAEVVIFDTAYKFFSGDIESSKSLSKAFEVLDRVIHETGCSVVMTHHHKKGQQGKRGENNDIADPDNVAGSFLWTGWPNGTILLNYLNRSVENPFNAICTFTAFRDAAPPEPLTLYRSRESIGYTAIADYQHQEEQQASRPAMQHIKPTADLVADLLIKAVPCVEDDFLHLAAGKFGCRPETVKPHLLDLLSQGVFVRTGTRPAILQYAGDVTGEETYEEEHGMPVPEPPTTQLHLVVDNTEQSTPV